MDFGQDFKRLEEIKEYLKNEKSKQKTYMLYGICYFIWHQYSNVNFL
jgi:hypothetical protein